MKSSPVKGYVTEDGYVTRNDKNYLRFKPFTRKFWITCLICSIIVLLLGVCGGYALNDFIGGKADNQEISKLTKENADLKSRIKELENATTIMHQKAQRVIVMKISRCSNFIYRP